MIAQWIGASGASSVQDTGLVMWEIQIRIKNVPALKSWASSLGGQNMTPQNEDFFFYSFLSLLFILKKWPYSIC